MCYMAPSHFEYPARKLSQLFHLKELAVRLTNIFHVAVRLFSNRSQITLKCGVTKKWQSVTDVLTTF